MLLISALLSVCIIFTARIERQKASRMAWTSLCRERVGLQSGIRVMMTLAVSSITSSLSVHRGNAVFRPLCAW